MIPHIYISANEYKRAAAVAGFQIDSISFKNDARTRDQAVKVDAVLMLAFRRGLAEMEKDPPVWKGAKRKTKRKEE